ncbi:MAG: hypothetical protein ACREUG_05905, partial [Steroidobacteraceae bacterium]
MSTIGAAVAHNVLSTGPQETLSVRKFLPLALLIGIAGCSSLPPMRDTLEHFDEGAHTVATAQLTFLSAVQFADCDEQFLSKAYDYAHGQDGIDLRASCQPSVLPAEQVETRQALLNAIILYVDQLQAMAAAGDDQSLDTNEQDLAAKANALAQAHGFSNLSAPADVEAAVIGLTGMVLDRRKSRTLVSAAREQQPALSKVVAALQNENVELAAAIDSNLVVVRAELAAVLAEVRNHDHEKVFFDAVQARGILQAADPFHASAPLTPDDPQAEDAKRTSQVVAQLNDALEAIVQANHALATSGPGGVKAAVPDLIVRARAAQR